jgi:hypothetical protein
MVVGEPLGRCGVCGVQNLAAGRGGCRGNRRARCPATSERGTRHSYGGRNGARCHLVEPPTLRQLSQTIRHSSTHRTPVSASALNQVGGPYGSVRCPEQPRTRAAGEARRDVELGYFLVEGGDEDHLGTRRFEPGPTAVEQRSPDP